MHCTFKGKLQTINFPLCEKYKNELTVLLQPGRNESGQGGSSGRGGRTGRGGRHQGGQETETSPTTEQR